MGRRSAGEGGEATRERAALARAAYAAGRPVAGILAEHAVACAVLYAWLDGTGLGLPPVPRRQARAAGGCPRADPAAQRRAAVNRLWHLAGRGAGALARAADAGQEPDPRAVALAVRTLRELDRLDPAPAARDAARAALTREDDDADRLREEIARRLDRLGQEADEREADEREADEREAAEREAAEREAAERERGEGTGGPGGPGAAAAAA